MTSGSLLFCLSARTIHGYLQCEAWSQEEHVKAARSSMEDKGFFAHASATHNHSTLRHLCPPHKPLSHTREVLDARLCLVLVLG